MKKLAYALFTLTFALLAPTSLALANVITPSEPDDEFLDIEHVPDEQDHEDLSIQPRDGEYLEIVPISEGGEGICLEATPGYCENAQDLMDELTDENSSNFIVHSLTGLAAVVGFVGITLYVRNR